MAPNVSENDVHVDLPVDAATVDVAAAEGNPMSKAQSVAERESKWDVTVQEEIGTPWSELSGADRTKRVLIFWIGRTALLLGLLYLFIISLDILGSAFSIMGGPTAGKAFRENEIMNNPIAGVCIGILATVLVQSSSTSTSIVISMVASHILTLKQSVPIIMGANIGTSVTNTIVSFGHVKDRDEFMRGFAGATVHDMFNCLSVIVFLPIEAAVGMLRHLSIACVDSMHIPSEKAEKMEILKKLTGPLVQKIVIIDKKLITKIAQESDAAKLAELELKSMVDKSDKYSHWFSSSSWSDGAIGAVLLVLSLVLLCGCLFLIVKVLHSMMKGRMAMFVQKSLNIEFRAPFGWASGYVLILVGMGVTFVVQSSSITTSTLTPLVAVGLLKIENMFPLTLGANVGTTLTGIISALASSDIPEALKCSFCHLFFNIAGILLWYPVPAMRRVPIDLAKAMGRITADNPWFPIAYTVVTFVAIPGVFFLLSLASAAAAVVVLVLMLLLAGLWAALMYAQRTRPEKVPPALMRLNSQRLFPFIKQPEWERVDSAHSGSEPGTEMTASKAVA